MQLTISGRTVGRVLLGILIGASLGGLVWLGVAQLRPEDPFGGAVDPDRWQAVFLSNGEVYYGRLEEAGEDFFELREAYYVQETPPVEEGAEPTRQVRPVTEQFHQPEQTLLIAEAFVIRVQNLRPDSDVAEAIERVEAAGP